LRLVCRCANVKEKDVLEFKEVCPNMSVHNIKAALKIGIGCGQCNRMESRITDITIEELLQKPVKPSH